MLNTHQNKAIKIFLATDSNFVINHFKKLFKDKIYYIETYRAQSKEDPHLIYENAKYFMANPHIWHQRKPGYKGGLGALVDCLLLAKCDYLIHTMSNVSTFVTFFNPHIQSIYLPKGTPFKHCGWRGHPSIKNPFLNPI